MRAVAQQLALAEQHGLFKRAKASDVVSNLLCLMLNFSCCSQSSLSQRPLPVATSVDVFISHSWSCPAWMKILAICHHMNFDFAIILSSLAGMMSVLALVLHAGSLHTVSQMDWNLLSFCLLGCPMVAFLVAYLFGHLCSSQTFWFDRLCVDQGHAMLRAQTLRAVPAFIAKSRQILILWDGTFFDRLWCIYELAVQAKTSTTDCIKIVPMWKPMWVLSFCLGLWTGVGLLVAFCDKDEPPLKTETRASMFVSFYSNYAWTPVSFIFISPFFSWLCLQKLQQHKSMLDSMLKFDIRNAKCMLETDRQTIVEQVLSLFDEALEPPIKVSFASDISEVVDEDANTPLVLSESFQEIRHITSYPNNEEILDQFNAYVRGPVCDSVVKSMGKEEYISFSLCLVTIMPAIWSGAVYVLGCDGDTDCEKSAVDRGYRSVSQYMLGNAIMNLIVQPLIVSMTCPLVLQTIHWVASFAVGSAPRMIIGSLINALVLFLWNSFCIAECGMCLVVFARYSHSWCVFFVAGLIVPLWMVWFLYFRRRTRARQSPTLLCS